MSAPVIAGVPTDGLKPADLLWASVLNKPWYFPPSPHSHGAGDLPVNIAFKDQANTFTADQVIRGNLLLENAGGYDLLLGLNDGSGRVMIASSDFAELSLNPSANIWLNRASGNTLIGSTTDNGSKLQVNGNITATGTASFGSGPSGSGGTVTSWGNNGYPSWNLLTPANQGFQVLNGGNWWLYVTENIGLEVRTNGVTRTLTDSSGLAVTGNLQVSGGLITQAGDQAKSFQLATINAYVNLPTSGALRLRDSSNSYAETILLTPGTGSIETSGRIQSTAGPIISGGPGTYSGSFISSKATLDSTAHIYMVRTGVQGWLLRQLYNDLDFHSLSGNTPLTISEAGITTTNIDAVGTLSVTSPTSGTLASFGANGVSGLLQIKYDEYTSGAIALQSSVYGPMVLATQVNNNIVIAPHGTGKVGIGNMYAPPEMLSVGGNIFASGRIQSGIGGVSQGYLNLQPAGGGGGEANIYAIPTGGLRIDTGGNGFPIYIDGSSVGISSPVTISNTLAVTGTATVSTGGAIVQINSSGVTANNTESGTNTVRVGSAYGYPGLYGSTLNHVSENDTHVFRRGGAGSAAPLATLNTSGLEVVGNITASRVTANEQVHAKGGWLEFFDSGSSKWLEYVVGNTLYFRDRINNRDQITCTPGSSVTAAWTSVNSRLHTYGVLYAEAGLDVTGNITATGTVDITGSGVTETQLIWARGNNDPAFVSSMKTGVAGAAAVQSSIGLDYGASSLDFAAIKFYRNSSSGELHFYTSSTLAADGTSKMRLAGNGDLSVTGNITGSSVANTFGAVSAGSVTRILAGGSGSPVLSLFNSGNNEGFVAQVPGGLLFGCTGGLADLSNATLSAAAQLSIASNGNAFFTGNIEQGAGGGTNRITMSGLNSTYRTVFENNYDSERSFAIAHGGSDLFSAKSGGYYNITVGNSDSQEINLNATTVTTRGDYKSKGQAGGWLRSYGFKGSAGSELGGYGIGGTNDTADLFWIGPSYANPLLTMDATTLQSNSLNFNTKAYAGGWGAQHGFLGSGGANLGGYGMVGTSNTSDHFWIGPSYTDFHLRLTAATVSAYSSTLGHLQMSRGSTVHTGYMEWYRGGSQSSAKARQGYMGYDAGLDITIQNEQGGYLKTNSMIVAGANTSTSGTRVLTATYDGNLPNHMAAGIVTEYSSGSIGLAFGMYQEGGINWLSGWGYAATPRTALLNGFYGLRFIATTATNASPGVALPAQPTTVFSVSPIGNVTASGALHVTGEIYAGYGVFVNNNWLFYRNAGDPSLYVRDLVNSRMQVTYLPGASSTAALTTFDSRVGISGGYAELSGPINAHLAMYPTYGAGSSIIDFKALGSSLQDSRICGGQGSSSNIVFYTGGATLVERMRIEDAGVTLTGKVTAPYFEAASTNPYLTIKHTSWGGGDYQLYGKANGDIAFYNGPADRMVLTTNGNIGVGLTNPLARLHVSGPAATVNYTSEHVLMLSRPYAGGISYSPSASFKLCNPAFATPYSRLDIALLNTGMGVETLPDTTVMSLLSNGNVGIGTTGPTELLHVKGGVASGIHMESTGAYGILRLTTTGGESLIVPSQDNLHFYTGALSSATVKMSITGDGKVGIGTTTPGKTLELTSSADWSAKMRMRGTSSQFWDVGCTYSYNNSELLFTNTAGNSVVSMRQDGATEFWSNSGQVLTISGNDIRGYSNALYITAGTSMVLRTDAASVEALTLAQNGTATFVNKVIAPRMLVGAPYDDGSTVVVAGQLTTTGNVHTEANQNALVSHVVRNINTGSDAYSRTVYNAYGNAWAVGMGSAANNACAFEIREDCFNSLGTLRFKLEVGGNATFYNQVSAVDFRFSSDGSYMNTGSGATNFLTSSNAAQPIKVGGLVVSNSYADVAPTNGIFCLGNATISGSITSTFQSLSADPTTLDLSAGQSRLVKNTTSGLLRLYANDSGTIKSVALT